MSMSAAHYSRCEQVVEACHIWQALQQQRWPGTATPSCTPPYCTALFSGSSTAPSRPVPHCGAHTAHHCQLLAAAISQSAVCCMHHCLPHAGQPAPQCTWQSPLSRPDGPSFMPAQPHIPFCSQRMCICRRSSQASPQRAQSPSRARSRRPSPPRAALRPQAF